MTRPDAASPQPPAPGPGGYAGPGIRPQRDVFAGYARLYAAFALFALTLSFQPLFVRVDEASGIEQPVLSMWDEVAETGHEISVLAASFFVVLSVLLLVGAFGVRSVGLAVGIALAAAVLVLLILIRPGYGDTTPDLNSWGQIGVVLGIVGVVLACAHAVHLGLARRTAGG